MVKLHFVTKDGLLQFASLDEDAAKEYMDSLIEDNVRVARDELGYDDDDYSEQHDFDAAFKAGADSPVGIFSLDVPSALANQVRYSDMSVDEWVDGEDHSDIAGCDNQEIADFCEEFFCGVDNDEYDDTDDWFAYENIDYNYDGEDDEDDEDWDDEGWGDPVEDPNDY